VQAVPGRSGFMNSRPERASAPGSKAPVPARWVDSALAWARAKGLLPKPSRERMPWEGTPGLGWLNWTLVLANVLIAVTLVWYLAWGLAGRGGSGSGQGIPGGHGSRTEQTQGGPDTSQAQPLSSYNVRLRDDLFGLGPGTELAPATPTAGPVPGDLLLQGVILGEPPQAIIYDTRRGVTYVVARGDRIGDMTVEEINEEAVVVSFKDERFDLKL